MHTHHINTFRSFFFNVQVLRTQVLKTGNDICPLPVNLARLIWNAQKLFKCGPAQTIGGGSSPQQGLRVQGQP